MVINRTLGRAAFGSFRGLADEKAGRKLRIRNKISEPALFINLVSNGGRPGWTKRPRRDFGSEPIPAFPLEAFIDSVSPT
jgi:hypothetical protein